MPTPTINPVQESDRDVDVENIVPSRALLANSLIDFLKLDSSIDPGTPDIEPCPSGHQLRTNPDLLNGLRISDVQTGHYSMDIPIPLSSVDRIEVLKGAGSTMYGSDAVGGAVNIVTRTPDADDFSVRLAAGNFGAHEERADGTFVLGPWAQSLSFSHDFSDGFTYDRDYRDLQFGSGRICAIPSARYHAGLRRPGRCRRQIQFYGNFNSFEHTKVWFAGLRTFARQERSRNRGGRSTIAATATSSDAAARQLTYAQSACRRYLSGGAAAFREAWAQHALPLRRGDDPRRHRQ